MTRCVDFYEKLERDGNFCGMREQEFRAAVEYFKHVEKDNNGKPLLSFNAYRKQQKKIAEANEHKTEKARQTKAAKKEVEEPEEETCEIIERITDGGVPYTTSTCAFKAQRENMEHALSILVEIGSIPEEIETQIEDWINLKYGEEK